MGRYYTGDIEGKFWFGTQPSDDAEQFGAVESTVTYYSVEEMEDNDRKCEVRLTEIFGELGLAVDLEMNPEAVYELYESDTEQSDARRSLYASLQLGLKIYQCLVKEGQCNFEVEV